MLNLQQIESDLVIAMKAKDQLSVEVLRGLKTRVQNEKTALKNRTEEAVETSLNGELTEIQIVALIRSEVKRRKESAQVYIQGARAELAEKELKEAAILEKYLPAQMSDADLSALVEKAIAENGFVAKDFGAAMGKLKAQVGDKAEGSVLARILKEKLK